MLEPLAGYVPVAADFGRISLLVRPNPAGGAALAIWACRAGWDGGTLRNDDTNLPELRVGPARVPTAGWFYHLPEVRNIEPSEASTAGDSNIADWTRA
jgi:hypothetical protein